MPKHRPQSESALDPDLPISEPERSIALSQRTAAGNGDEPAKPKPTKAESFVKLARRRQPKLEKVCSALANLARKASYAYTDEQRDAIVRHAKKHLQRIIDAFMGQVSQSDDPDRV